MKDIIFVFQSMYDIQLLKKIGHHLKVLSINISVTSEHKHARFKVEDSIKIPFPTSLTFNFFSFCWFASTTAKASLYRTRGQHANHYTTDAVKILRKHLHHLVICRSSCYPILTFTDWFYFYSSFLLIILL
jgi:hypothetical protein